VDISDFFGQLQPPVPGESNPHKYPRRVEIEDQSLIDALMIADAKLDALNRLNEQMRDLQESAQILASERQIILTKFWRACRETYPAVHLPHDDGERGMVGWRKYQGGYWYVGWPLGW
jgi:hypothetical protein